MNKKSVLLVFGVFAFLAVSVQSVIASWAGVDIVVTVENPSVSLLSSNNIAITMPPSSTIVISTPIRVQSNGNISENLRIVGQISGGPEYTCSVPSPSLFRVEGIWHSATVPGSSEFQTNDCITTTAQTSSDTVFFDDNDTTSLSTNGGVGVPVSGTRNLFIKVESPSSSGSSPTMSFTVTAIAQ